MQGVAIPVTKKMCNHQAVAVVGPDQDKIDFDGLMKIFNFASIYDLAVAYGGGLRNQLKRAILGSKMML